ncbi:MAG TPA: tetratricopeptide repeat protein [Pyrinomonadaceae bacterium]|jgi:tetratricopeptide (TPR) repeat protein
MLSAQAKLPAVTLCLVLLAAPPARAQGAAAQGRLERAAAAIAADRLAEAEQQLNAILKAAPADALALNLLGTVRAKQKRLDEAEALFLRATRADRGFVGAHMNLAYLYLLKGAPEKTAAELREVLRLDPAHADAAGKLAGLVCAQESGLEECLRLGEGERAAGRLTPALALLLGGAYLKRGDAARAEEMYLRVLGAVAASAEAQLGMALVSRARGDARGAALYLTRAKESAGDSHETLYRLAVAALKSGMYGDAREALERAARLAPAEPAYRVALGAVWLKKPDLFEAERAFREALRLRPEDPRAQMYLGYTLLKQKKAAEARELLERSARGDAASPETFYYLGLAAQEQGEDERAVEHFGTAVRLLPTFAQAHVALGAVYLKLKQYPRAQAALEAGVKLNPDDSKAHYNLARLYAQLKDPKRARAEMEIVERLKSEGKAQEDDAQAPPGPR